MNQPINERQNASENEIAERAYYLWESEGRPEGRDLEYWMKAKAQLSNRRGGTALAGAQNSGKNEPAVAQNAEKQPQQQPRKQKSEQRTDVRPQTGKQPAFA